MKLVDAKYRFLCVILKTVRSALLLLFFLCALVRIVSNDTVTPIISVSPATSFNYGITKVMSAPYAPLIFPSDRYHPDKNGIWRKRTNRFTYACPAMLKYNIHSLIIRALNTPASRMDLLPVKSTIRTSAGSDSRTALCMFTGDIMCLGGQQSEARTPDGFDFWPSFRLVSRFFEQADFVCGNLETVLSDSHPITLDQRLAGDGNPQCNGPVEFLRALRKAGYDMLITANNHTCDWGMSGIEETKNNLDAYRFANLGTYDDRFTIFDINGIHLAILCYTRIMNQRDSMPGGLLEKTVHMYSPEVVTEDINAARSAGADFIVVYCHWGTENTRELDTKQKTDAAIIAKAGADLIIGSHPHCLQSCEYIETADGRKVLCMYSLGNFSSSMLRVDINRDTVILQVKLGYDPDSEGISIRDISYIPCRITEYRGRNLVIVPTDPSLNGGYSGSNLKESEMRTDTVMNGVIPKYTPR